MANAQFNRSTINMEEFREDWVMGLKLEDCRGIATLYIQLDDELYCIQSLSYRIGKGLPALDHFNHTAGYTTFKRTRRISYPNFQIQKFQGKIFSTNLDTTVKFKNGRLRIMHVNMSKTNHLTPRFNHLPWLPFQLRPLMVNTKILKKYTVQI